MAQEDLLDLYFLLGYSKKRGEMMNTEALHTEPRSANIRARVSEDVKRRWQSAASIRGLTLTDFLIVAANNESDEVFEREERTELSERDQIALAELIMKPPELSDIFKSALKEQIKLAKGA